MNTKKRLALMPEVLPTPQRSSGQTSSVRSRTLARLKVLAALGAVGIAAACGGKADDGGGGGGGGGGGPDGGLPREGGPGQPDAYGVVDPLPPPACFPQSTPPTATARYLTDDAGVSFDAGAGFDPGTRVVEVDLSWSLANVVLGSFYPSGDTTLLESSSSSNGARLTLAVGPVKAADSSISISCTTGPSQLYIHLQLDADSVVVDVREH